MRLSIKITIIKMITKEQMRVLLNLLREIKEKIIRKRIGEVKQSLKKLKLKNKKNNENKNKNN